MATIGLYEAALLRAVAMGEDVGTDARAQGFPFGPRCTEQRREARRRIEARQAEPIDRAVATDERGALAVAEQRIVFDTQRHQDLAPLSLCSSRTLN